MGDCLRVGGGRARTVCPFKGEGGKGGLVRKRDGFLMGGEVVDTPMHTMKCQILYSNGSSIIF